VKLTIKGIGAIEMSEQTQSVDLEKDGAWHTQFPLKGIAIGDGAVSFTVSGEDFEPITRTFEMTVRPATAPTSTKETLLLQPGETKTLSVRERNSFLPNTASFTITASDRIPWDLTTILKTLTTYPYECIEQTLSRGFALLYKKSMGIVSDSETAKDLDKALFRVLSILAEKQDREGAFPLWSIYETGSDVWLTAYAFDFMQQAKAQGIKVPEYTFEKAGEYLRGFVKSQTSNSSPQKLAVASLFSLSFGGARNY